MIQQPQSPVQVLVIADDLSGGADSGVQFARPGRPSLLLLNPDYRLDDAKQYSARVLDTESRSLSAQAAAVRVTSCCPPEPEAQYIYKKIDSTLRGNIGAELEALMGLYGIRRTLICPAYPEQGRQLVGGRLHIASRPMEIRTGAQQEKLPHTNHLPSLLRSQTSLPVVELDRPAGEHPLQDLLSQIEQHPEGIFALDASDDADLSVIARAGLELGSRCLLCGSAGLAAQFSRLLNPEPPSLTTPPINCRKILLVAGSRQEVTSMQIEQLLRNLPAHVVPLTAGEDRRVRLASPLETFTSDLVVLSSASLPYLEGSEDHVAGDLAQIAGQIIHQHGMEGIVLTGGATALAVCQELGAGALEIGHQALPGVPLGRILDGECQGIWVVTKAGGFGSPLALVRIVEFMRGKPSDE